jgi:hypothetical protein
LVSDSGFKAAKPLRPKLGLLPKGVAVDDKTNALEAVSSEQAIEQRDREFGLAGARRHGEQHLATIGFKGFFDFLDDALLIGTQRKAKVEPAPRASHCRQLHAGRCLS